MRKVCGGHLTAGILSKNISETVMSFIANNKVYCFINTIKGTPVYWKKFLYEVAVVKELGLTYFLKLLLLMIH